MLNEGAKLYKFTTAINYNFFLKNLEKCRINQRLILIFTTVILLV